MGTKASIQYASAVALIMSSIALAFLQDIVGGDITHGTLIYIAQAFLLAGSIFGLDYYVNKITNIIKHGHSKTKGNTE